MFLWVGVEITNSFLDELICKCKHYNKSLNLDEQAFALLSHISLKISFDIKDNNQEDVIEGITKLFNNYKPFTILSDKIEKNNNIIWIKIKENKTLKKIHEELDNLLLNEYKIEQHEFDKAFEYHTTLFIDDDVNKINSMYELIKDIDVSFGKLVDTVLIGKSESGLKGTYKIIEKIKI